MATKKHKNELLETEEIFSLYEKIQVYVVENARQMAVAGVIICVVAVATGMWVVKQNSDDKNASLLLSSAMNIMAASAENIVDREMNYNKALDRLKSLEEKYPGTTSGRVALFYMGVCNYGLKKYDEAVSSYEEFLRTHDEKFGFLKSSVYECIGYCFEGKGDHEKALVYFTKQKNEGENNKNSKALLHIGSCYEKMGKTDEACNAYEEFIAADPSVMDKTIAQMRSAELCKKKEG